MPMAHSSLKSNPRLAGRPSWTDSLKPCHQNSKDLRKAPAETWQWKPGASVLTDGKMTLPSVHGKVRFPLKSPRKQTGCTRDVQRLYKGCTTVVRGMYKGSARSQPPRNALASRLHQADNRLSPPGMPGYRGVSSALATPIRPGHALRNRRCRAVKPQPAARSVWGAWSLLPLSSRHHRRKAPASWSHSKRFAWQSVRRKPRDLRGTGCGRGGEDNVDISTIVL